MNFAMKSQKAALTKALLDGRELSIMNCFQLLAITNCPREIGRSIVNSETGFGAKVIKTKVNITTQYGTHGYYFTYKLDRSESNKDAIKKMKEYLSSCEINPVKNVIANSKPRYIEQTLF